MYDIKSKNTRSSADLRDLRNYAIKHIIDYNLKHNQQQYDINTFIYHNNVFILPLYHDTQSDISLYMNFNEKCLLYDDPLQNIMPTKITSMESKSKKLIYNIIAEYRNKLQ